MLLPNGDHYLSHPYAIQQSLKKYNLADRPYFQEATRSKKTAISDSILGADGMPAVVIDTPLWLEPVRGNLRPPRRCGVPPACVLPAFSGNNIAPFDYGLLARP
jgi:hypothetical protein